jgi:hypothetical protein
MALDLGLRDGSFSYLKDKKGLTRGTHIEAASRRYPPRNFLVRENLFL